MQLVEHCLANLAEDRPSADEVLQQLEGMNIDDPHRGLTRLDMIRMVGQNEEEIQRNIQESQHKDVEIQRRDEEIQRKDDEVRQKSEEIRRKDGEKQSLQSQVHQLQVCILHSLLPLCVFVKKCWYHLMPCICLYRRKYSSSTLKLKLCQSESQ